MSMKTRNNIISVVLIALLLSTGIAYAEDWNLGVPSLFTNATFSGILTQNGANLAGSAYQNQSFQNLLKNGNFELWSAGVSAAPDGWTLIGGGTVAREGTIKRIGTYSANITRSGTDNYLTQDVFNPYYIGKTITVGMWIYATSASRGMFRIYDGVGLTTSSYHTGDSTWQFITASHTLNAGATVLQIQPYVATADTSVYFDGAILVEGSVVPAFSAHPFDLTLAETRFKVGSFTHDISVAGTQTITGVGFKPSYVSFVAAVPATKLYSTGMDDGTNAITIGTDANDGNQYIDTPKSIYMINNIVTAVSQAHITTLGSDGFTITWNIGGTPTGTATIIYTAYR